MSITLDDDKQIVHGEEVITYTNNSPDVLEYLWLQLDQNIYKPDAESNFIEVEKMEDFKSIRDVENKLFVFEGGYNIESVSSVKEKKIKYAINHTMMRTDPKNPPGQKQSFSFFPRS